MAELQMIDQLLMHRRDRSVLDFIDGAGEKEGQLRVGAVNQKCLGPGAIGFTMGSEAAPKVLLDFGMKRLDVVVFSADVLDIYALFVTRVSKNCPG